MRPFIFIILLITEIPLFGQSFSYPVIKDSGKTIKSFIPPNWFLRTSTEGDLNGDSTKDIALVIECKDTINEIRPNNKTNRARPRILLILFKNNNSGFYHLVLQNNTLIMRNGESGLDNDFISKLSISKRILSIEYEFIRNYDIYKFRYQNGDFYLIGAVSGGVAGGEFFGCDINFLTKKAKETTSDPSGYHEKIKWLTISLDRPVKLKDFKMLATLEVMPGLFL